MVNRKHEQLKHGAWLSRMPAGLRVEVGSDITLLGWELAPGSQCSRLLTEALVLQARLDEETRRDSLLQGPAALGR